jgi:hypothetical protein
MYGPSFLATIPGPGLALLAAAVLVCAPSWAQEEPPGQSEAQAGEQAREQTPGPEDSATEGAEAEAAESGEPGAVDDSVYEPGFDDSELDDQTYDEDDDVFVPTEEIPADEPIPFPSDI